MKRRNREYGLGNGSKSWRNGGGASVWEEIDPKLVEVGEKAGEIMKMGREIGFGILLAGEALHFG